MLVHDYLEYWARVTPSTACIEDDDGVWTYAEVNARSDRVAEALASLGLVPGDRLAVLSENRVEYLPLYFGAFKAGVVPVPLNYRLHPREWVHIVNDAGARAVIAESRYTAALDSVRPGLDGVGRFVALGESGRGWLAFDQVVGSATGETTDHRVDETADLYQMYTSGTTGRPKGAVLTHRAVDSNIRQTQIVLGLRPGSRALIVMPLYHAGAAVQCFSVVASGGTILLRPGFDAADCVQTMDERGVATATFVPAMIQAMLVGVPEVGDRAFLSLERIAYGASPIAEETLRQAIQVFGCDFVQATGMTECSSVVTLLGPDDHRLALAGRPELLLSCGRPAVGTRVRVVDDLDRDTGPGEKGEILVSGPQTMRGYWNMPDATADALRDGWMHTGDAGHLDEDGYLYVSDRVKDMIVSGGENVYPREVEDVLFRMPEIADAAVIGVPDERWGETVKAVVVVRPGLSVTESAVIAWCRDRLAGFKCPRSVDLVDELPRNPSGKVLKRVLREPHWVNEARSVG
ncbi:MAG TPA: long-chain-fatty-acid--CoA ligase [Acidimicrobiales bacterium]|nr:long-chain-fatty-acid--CoA ligase [Acidimicrobiales bacterium]